MLNKEIFNVISLSNNIEDNWSTFKMIYHNLVDKHIPFKYLVPGKHYKVPWLNDHIVKRAKAKRSKAKVNLNWTGLLADYCTYRHAMIMILQLQRLNSDMKLT